MTTNALLAPAEAAELPAGVHLFTKPTCPHCLKAKRLLQEKGVEYSEHYVDTPEAIKAMLHHSGGRNTVPQIFINGKHIGGNDDLQALNASGGLDPALASVRRKDYSAPGAGKLSNIDRQGVTGRYVMGTVMAVVAAVVVIATILGAPHSRWWRLFSFPVIAASLTTLGQAQAST